MRPSMYSRSASGKIVRRYSSTETSVGVPMTRFNWTTLLHCGPSHPLHHLADCGHDAVLNLFIVGAGQAVVDHAVVGLIAALFEHAERGNVGHDVVRVSGDDDSFAAEFAFDAQNVIDDHFAAEGDEGQVLAELDGLHGVWITADEGAAVVVELQHGFRVADTMDI